MPFALLSPCQQRPVELPHSAKYNDPKSHGNFAAEQRESYLHLNVVSFIFESTRAEMLTGRTHQN
jgi:hypothetical protein